MEEYWFDFNLPQARFRDRLAPELCDICWKKFREMMCDMGHSSRRRSRYIPPFRQIYLWHWVAMQLEIRARRLVPHLAEKAARGAGVIRKGSSRPYTGGPYRERHTSFLGMSR